MSRRRTLWAVAAIAAALPAFAAAPQDGGKPRCQPTERRGDLAMYPGEGNVPTSNNLRRRQGMAQAAAGTPLLVEGKVLDQNCVPVYGAVVELWQANAAGVYQTRSRGASADPYFAGAGRALTDNTGRYRFITVLPGVVGKSSPRLHLRVSHPDFTGLVTEVTLGADAPKARGRGIFAFPRPLDPGAPDAGQHLLFDMVLRGHQPYRTY